MDVKYAKAATFAIQTLILVFAFCLVWFAFVYYPGITRDGNFLRTFRRSFQNRAVSSSSKSFPIESQNYRITYEQGSNLYYVFVNGDSTDVYVENKIAAELALKNALSVETLCAVKVVYSSTAKLEMPSEFKSSSDCN